MKVKDLGVKVKSERRSHPYKGKSRLKLSKNLLEMKFMKRTKESQKEAEEQEEYEKMFESCQSVVESGVRVNYLQDITCASPLLFARRSYGGFNAAVERLMTQHDDVNSGDVTLAGQTTPSMHEPPGTVDVSATEMAACLGGATRTIGRKFATKRQRATGDSNNNNSSGGGGSGVLQRVKKFLRPPEH